MDKKFLKEQITEIHLNQGKTVNETIKQLNITKYKFYKIIEELKLEGTYKKKSTPNLDEKDKMYRKKIIDIICKQYLDYNREKKFISILPKEIKKLADNLGYELIYFTIRENMQMLETVNSKTFTSHYAKIKYIIKIIENNSNKTKTKLEKIKKSHKIKENCLDVVEIKPTQIHYQNNKTDLSSLLDE